MNHIYKFHFRSGVFLSLNKHSRQGASLRVQLFVMKGEEDGYTHPTGWQTRPVKKKVNDISSGSIDIYCDTRIEIFTWKRKVGSYLHFKCFIFIARGFWSQVFFLPASTNMTEREQITKWELLWSSDNKPDIDDLQLLGLSNSVLVCPLWANQSVLWVILMSPICGTNMMCRWLESWQEGKAVLLHGRFSQVSHTYSPRPKKMTCIKQQTILETRFKFSFLAMAFIFIFDFIVNVQQTFPVFGIDWCEREWRHIMK